MWRRRPIINSPAAMVFGQLGSAAIALVTSPVIARAIGVEGRGQIAAILAAFLLTPVIIGIGMPPAIKRLSTLPTFDDALRAARKFSLALFPLSLAIALAAWFLAFRDEVSSSLALVVIFGIALSPAAVLWACDISLLVARERFAAVMLLQLTLPTVVLVAVVVMVAADRGSVEAVLWTNIAASLTTLVASQLLTATKLNGHSTPLREIVPEAATYAPGAIADAASNFLPAILALSLIGSYQSGLLAVGVTVAGLMLAVGQSMSAGAFRTFAVLTQDSVRSAYIRVNRDVCSLVAAAAIPSIAATPVVVPVVFGSDFRAAVVPTMICLIGSTLAAIGLVQIAMLGSRARGRAVSTAQVLGLVIQLLLTAALMDIGAIGAAAAYAVRGLVVLVALSISLRMPMNCFLPTPQHLRSGLRSLLRRPETVGAG